jgi:hypothetical protein
MNVGNLQSSWQHLTAQIYIDTQFTVRYKARPKLSNLDDPSEN